MSLSKALAATDSPDRLRQGCDEPSRRRAKAEGLRYWNAARCALAVLAAHAHTSDVLQAHAHTQEALVVQSAPAPAFRATFKEAIDRAIENNPTVAAAASGILAAEGLIRQARADTLTRVTSDITWTNLNRGVEFQGTIVTPRSQVTASVTAGQPILAGAAWARRAQAEDTKNVAELNVANVKRQVAFATADAFLTIITQRRLVEANLRAFEVARAHFDLATELERQGMGSRLNALRAQQQMSTDEGLVEIARLGVYRAQEALGVLMAVGGPVDAADEPDFPVPPGADQAAPLSLLRTDLKLFAAEEQSAARIVRDSSKDYWPTIDALFSPSTTHPAQFFLPANSWRFLVLGNVPIFDSGRRAGIRVQREAAVEEARANLAGATTRAGAEVRAAREAVASGERTLTTARAVADQARQVLNITNISFRAGASTNIEVIDAQRISRDADMAVAVTEDTLRRAKLELLNALGRFP
jgi:outer membrane protein TolC